MKFDAILMAVALNDIVDSFPSASPSRVSIKCLCEIKLGFTLGNRVWRRILIKALLSNIKFVSEWNSSSLITILNNSVFEQIFRKRIIEIFEKLKLN